MIRWSGIHKVFARGSGDRVKEPHALSVWRDHRHGLIGRREQQAVIEEAASAGTRPTCGTAVASGHALRGGRGRPVSSLERRARRQLAGGATSQISNDSPGNPPPGSSGTVTAASREPRGPNAIPRAGDVGNGTRASTLRETRNSIASLRNCVRSSDSGCRSATASLIKPTNRRSGGPGTFENRVTVAAFRASAASPSTSRPGLPRPVRRVLVSPIAFSLARSRRGRDWRCS